MPEFDSTIEYRDVPGFPGYKVSNTGEVWTCRLRGPKSGLGSEWRQLKPGLDTHGRLHVVFSPSKTSMLVHRAVLLAFVGPCPEGMEARHFPDRNPFNNHLSNLQWGTKKQNQADRVFHGTDCRGSKQGASRFTEEQVVEIRRAYAAKEMDTYELAEKYGVVQGTIWYIVAHKTWKHI